MPARTLPNMGLQAFYNLGEDGWKDGFDLNMLKLSVLSQGGVRASVDALPAEPVAGDVVILKTGEKANNIAIFDNGAWVYVAPAEGWFVYDRGADVYLSFQGGAWGEFKAGEGGGGGGDGGIPDAPADGKLYGRQDGEWAEVVAGSGGGGTPVPADYASSKSFRVVIASDENYGRSFSGFAEVQFLDADDIVLSQPIEQAAASSIYDSNWPAIRAFDNNLGNGWLAANGQRLNEFLVGTFPTEIRPRKLRIFPIGEFVQSLPKKVRVDYLDGPDWKEIATFDTAAPAANVGQVFDLPKVGGSSGGGSGGGAGATRKRPTVVQKAVIRNDGRIELPNQPTPGNKLYFLAAGYGASDTSYPPAGFARAGRHISNNNNSVTLDIMATITAATPKGFDVSAGDNQQAVLYEIADSEWAYPGLGGTIVYNGNNIFDLVNAPCPYSDEALVLLGLENDNTTRFAMPVQDKVIEDFNTPNDGLNHTGWLGRVDRPGAPLIVKGAVGGAAQDAVFGFFWVIGPEVASAGGGGGGGVGSMPWLTPPKAATFKTASGDATNIVLADDPDLGLTFDGGHPPQSDILRYAYIDIPDKTKSWSCEIKMDVETLKINYNGYGIGVFDTAQNRMVQLKQDEGGLRRARWTGLAAYEGNDATHLMYTFSGFLRVDFDAAANLYRYFISNNGKQWTPIGTSAAMSADRVGFFAHNNTQIADYKVQGAISHWSFKQ